MEKLINMENKLALKILTRIWLMTWVQIVFYHNSTLISCDKVGAGRLISYTCNNYKNLPECKRKSIPKVLWSAIQSPFCCDVFLILFFNLLCKRNWFPIYYLSNQKFINQIQWEMCVACISKPTIQQIRRHISQEACLFPYLVLIFVCLFWITWEENLYS